jgi:biotin operon repressor
MNKKLPAEELDRMFDAGEDISAYLDRRSTRHINQPIKRINVDMPTWMVKALDRQAERLNISRQAVIKNMLDAQLKSSDVVV